MKRKLTDLEKEFVDEAEKGSFLVGYTDNGTPYAMGAEKTDNLFSMDVVESPDGPDCSIYMLTE